MFSFLRPGSKKKAFALISVLILISILSMLVLEFSQRSLINIKMTNNYADSKKTFYYAFGGYQSALSILMNDKNNYDGPGDVWYNSYIPVPIENGSILIVIEDEKARFNIKKLVTPYGYEDKRRSAMLNRMFQALNIETSLVDAIIDWEDADDIEKTNGAEELYYAYLSSSYKPRNEPFITIGELLLVKGFNRDLLFLQPNKRSFMGNEEFKSLNSYITVYGDGKININTADIPVLLSLSKDINELIAKDIVEYRKKYPFKNINDLKNVDTVSEILYDEINSLITVRSNFFRITATGSCGSIVSIIKAVVLRETGGFRVVYFNRSL